MRCMENNVAPRAHMIIRKTHTTKVYLNDTTYCSLSPALTLVSKTDFGRF